MLLRKHNGLKCNEILFIFRYLASCFGKMSGFMFEYKKIDIFGAFSLLFF